MEPVFTVWANAYTWSITSPCPKVTLASKTLQVSERTWAESGPGLLCQIHQKTGKKKQNSKGKSGPKEHPFPTNSVS